jgi:hypothetical protein
MTLRSALALLCLALLPAAAWAQAPAAPTPDGRQRLALVVGIGSVGGRTVLPSAPRDAAAVAAALKAGGYDVLLRENPGSAELRAAFTQFREKLKPDGLGLVYLTGPMAQVDGRNLLVPAEVALNESAEGAAAAALLRVVGVPVQEALTALAGNPDAPRVLVLDGAYRIAPLSRLTPPGLARPRSPDGTVVMLGHVPLALQDLPPEPPAAADGSDPKSRAATRLARAMADALTLANVTVPEALRAVRLEVLDATGGRTQPAISGNLTSRVYFSQKPAVTVATPAAPAAPAPQAVLPVVVPVPVPAPVPIPVAAAPAPSAAASAPSAASAASAPAVAAAAKPTDGRTERAPGQGERPVYQTRSNSYGHAEGDVLSYERVDTRKDEVLASYVIAIDKIADNGMLQANGGLWQLDAEGRPVAVKSEDGAETRFEPAEAWWWARPAAGDARAVQFTESYLRADKSRGRISWRGQAQVGTKRTMEVQAGEFEVLPIRVTGQGTDAPEGKPAVQMLFTRVVYFAPKLGVPVAIDIENNDASGKPLKRERIELTHAQQSRTQNN